MVEGLRTRFHPCGRDLGFNLTAFAVRRMTRFKLLGATSSMLASRYAVPWCGGRWLQELRDVVDRRLCRFSRWDEQVRSYGLGILWRCRTG